jgi:RNase_H superfamily
MIDRSPLADSERARLLRRIESLRARRSEAAGPSAAPPAHPPEQIVDLRRRRAERFAHGLAAAVGGRVEESDAGRVVRVDRPPVRLPVDRHALAALPGQPAPTVPLVCLDTETTGLGTAAGNLAFLVGLGWWDEDWFVQAQLVLPDQPDEPALLAALRELLPPDGWLVTYNGRGFDWPLLVTRFRLDRSAPPDLGGHLDLLPVVRALFRHRLADARLRTVEADLLGLGRAGDVGGWEIPARYLAYLRDGDAGGIVEVVRHNHEDVRSLARLLRHLAATLGSPGDRRRAEPGDLAGLARLLARDGRNPEALECLDQALDRQVGGPASRAGGGTAAGGDAGAELPWWSPRVPADIGGRQLRGPQVAIREPGRDRPWTTERIERERARLLRRVGRVEDAVAAWRAIALRGGRVGALAWIEVAKLEEHILHDPGAALAAVERAAAQVARLRSIGLPIRGVDGDLSRRRARLARRVARGSRPARDRC